MCIPFERVCFPLGIWKEQVSAGEQSARFEFRRRSSMHASTNAERPRRDAAAKRPERATRPMSALGPGLLAGPSSRD